MAIQLEDELGDILAKARDGLSWSQNDLARAAGVSAGEIRRIESYEWVPDEALILRIADALDLHVTQIKRYESGSSQPSLEALKKMAKTLRVSIDSLVFDTEELTPDEDLALQFQAIAKMPDGEKAIIKQLIEGMIIKYETQRWSASAK